jgi:hypothetical protein
VFAYWASAKRGEAAKGVGKSSDAYNAQKIHKITNHEIIKDEDKKKKKKKKMNRKSPYCSCQIKQV